MKILENIQPHKKKFTTDLNVDRFLLSNCKLWKDLKTKYLLKHKKVDLRWKGTTHTPRKKLSNSVGCLEISFLHLSFSVFAFEKVDNMNDVNSCGIIVKFA